MTKPNPEPSVWPIPSPSQQTSSPSAIRREPREASESSTSRSSASSPIETKADVAEAVRCLIRCTELLVREIPRGVSARFEGVREEIRKARQALGERSSSSESSSPSIEHESAAHAEPPSSSPKS